MSATQRARSGVPLARRSAFPTLAGVPAWGGVAIAVAATFVGFLIDAVRGNELTAAFSVFYFLGCVAAVLAVRNRGLFTAMVQPPLLLVVAVPLAYQRFSPGGGGLKDLAFNVAIPLINRFPLMLATTLVVVAIGAGRIYIRRQAAGVLARPARARGSRNTEAAPSTRAARTATNRTATDRAAPSATAEPTQQQRTDRPHRTDPPNRLADEAAPAARPAHASGSFPTGRYPTRTRHSGPQEEQTETFDRPQEFTRAQPESRRRGYRARQYEPQSHDQRPHESRQHEQQQYEQQHDGRQYEQQHDPRAYEQPATRARRDRHEAPEVPLHPIPQVRYRDRDDQDPTYGYR